MIPDDIRSIRVTEFKMSSRETTDELFPQKREIPGRDSLQPHQTSEHQLSLPQVPDSQIKTHSGTLSKANTLPIHVAYLRFQGPNQPQSDPTAETHSEPKPHTYSPKFSERDPRSEFPPSETETAA